MSQEARRMLSEDTRGGRRRREIVRYLLVSKEATKYRLGKLLYGDGSRYQRSVTDHVNKLKEIGILDVKSRGHKKIISISEKGRFICMNLGFQAQSSRAEGVLSELSLFSKDLSDKEIGEGKKILTDEVMNACLEILERVMEQRQLPLESVGVRLSFVEKRDGTKSDCGLLDVYIATIAYYQEKYLLPKLHKALEKDGIGSRSVSALTETTAGDQELVALPAIRDGELEGRFDELIHWFENVAPQIPGFGFLPHIMSVSPRLSCLRQFIATMLQREREKTTLSRIVNEPRYAVPAVKIGAENGVDFVRACYVNAK